MLTKFFVQATNDRTDLIDTFSIEADELCNNLELLNACMKGAKAFGPDHAIWGYDITEFKYDYKREVAVIDVTLGNSQEMRATFTVK